MMKTKRHKKSVLNFPKKEKNGRVILKKKDLKYAVTSPVSRREVFQLICVVTAAVILKFTLHTAYPQLIFFLNNNLCFDKLK